jgi:gas vesicle protein
MSNDYRIENDSNGNGGAGFVLGLLTGATIGVGLGLLFAQKPGAELRNQLTDRANDLANQANEGYKRAAGTASEWADRGRDVFEKARGAAAKGADEAQRYVRETANSASAVARDAANTASGVARDAAKSASAMVDEAGHQASAAAAQGKASIQSSINDAAAAARRS